MQANAILALWSGGWVERTDASAIADRHRVEAVLGIGTVQSLDEAHRVVDAQLDTFASPQTQITVAIEPVNEAETPYLGFNIGDTVNVEGDPERVVGIGIKEDQDGRVTFAPLLRDVVLTREERTDQAIKKSVNGTLQGDSKVATPFNQITAAASVPSPADRGFMASMAHFGKSTTQSFANNTTDDWTLDEAETHIGPDCVAIDTTTLDSDSLELTLDGLYVILVEISGPSLAANGRYLLSEDIEFGDGSTVGDGVHSEDFSVSTVTKIPTVKRTYVIGADAGTVIGWNFLQTSGATRAFSFRGKLARIGANTEQARTLG